MFDIRITNPVHGPGRLLLANLSIHLTEVWNKTQAITSLSGKRACFMSVNYAGIR